MSLSARLKVIEERLGSAAHREEMEYRFERRRAAQQIMSNPARIKAAQKIVDLTKKIGSGAADQALFHAAIVELDQAMKNMEEIK